MSMLETATPDFVAAPLKAHAVASDGGLSTQLRHALRDTQDPDLAQAIHERQSLTVGGKNAKSFSAGQTQAPTQAMSSCVEQRSASPEEHDRSYFALLHKISKLEAANERLVREMVNIKNDARAYEEVARELEDDLTLATAENAENVATIAKLQASTDGAGATQARLISAELTIAGLRAKIDAELPLFIGPSSPATSIQAGQFPACSQEVLSFLVQSHASDDDSATEESAPELLARADSTADDRQETAVEESLVFLTYSRLRAHTQRAAVEYRRAVREQLQTVSRDRSQAVPRSCLADLFSTPQDMLDEEVLSEDEQESEVCARRKESWEKLPVSSRSLCSESIPELTDSAESAAETAIFSPRDACSDEEQDCVLELTYSRLRAHTQRAAVEYRRAVREQLQTLSREPGQAVPRSCLAYLLGTPMDMLDDEVLSEDEEESEVCARRKKSWDTRPLSPRSV